MSLNDSVTRLLFATDLHGNLPAYARLFALAREESVDAVILGGDLAPYLTRDVADPVESQSRFLLDSLGAELRALKADRPDIQVFAIPGNDDWSASQTALEALEADDGLLVAAHGRAIPLNGTWHLAGLAYVPVTPFSMSDFDRLDHDGWQPEIWPRRILFSQGHDLLDGQPVDFEARPTIAEELEALATLSPPARTLYVCHGPPAGLGLDLIQSSRGVGSQALADFITRYQPPLTLHGHIHESPRRSGRIAGQSGATTSVNPGDSATSLNALRIDLADSGHINLMQPCS